MTVAPQQLYTFRSSYTTLTYSKDDLRGLIAQIEASFTHSDIYVRALKRLQERLGSKANGLQLLVNALGREAIRLTLRELISTVSDTPPSSIEPPPESFTIPPVQQSTSHPSEALPVSNSKPNHHVQTLPSQLVDSAPEPNESLDSIHSGIVSTSSPQTNTHVGIAIAIPDHPVLADTVLIEEAPTINEDEVPVNVSTEGSDTTTTQPPLSVPTAAATQAIAHKPHPEPSNARETILSSIGQSLYEARCQQKIAIEQLHQRTCVPSHHIRALEDGIWHNLPEDIYLQGFIRLLGNALGLNGQDLSQQFSHQTLNTPAGGMTLSRATTKVPPSQQPSQIKQTHLYLGYAALMAGATGGLAWMVSQPTTMQESVVQPTDTSPPLSLLNQHNPNQGSLHVLANRIFEQINAIATPETLPPETPTNSIKH